MALTNLHTLSEKEYKDKLLGHLKPRENDELFNGRSNLDAHYDKVSSIALGYGYDLLQNVETLDKDLKDLVTFKNGNFDSLKKYIKTIKNLNETTSKEYVKKINSYITLQTEANASELLQATIDKFEKKLSDKLGGDDLDYSEERVGVMGQVYRLGVDGIPKLLSAIKADNRAEAWYEIRYNSDKHNLVGNFTRVIAESNYFHLYYDENNITEDEANNILAMCKKHKKFIDEKQGLSDEYSNDGDILNKVKKAVEHFGYKLKDNFQCYENIEKNSTNTTDTVPRGKTTEDFRTQEKTMTSVMRELTTKIDQKIVARVTFKDNPSESYSVYKLDGRSMVGASYSFTVSIVATSPIEIASLADTDVKVSIQDSYSVAQKDIFGKVYTINEDSIVGTKYMYKMQIVSPLYYLKFNNRYEIYLDKSVSGIITEVLNRHSSLLNIQIENKIDNKKEPKREYTTQYNQSDLDFISMLCEEEGYTLLYHFEDEDSEFFDSPFKITLCELNEHCKIAKGFASADFNLKKEFNSTYMIEDYFDDDKPSLDMKSSFGGGLNTELLSDNDTTKQLRNGIKRNIQRDKLNVYGESLFKDIKRYTQIDAYANMAQTRTIIASSQELFIHEGMSVELYDDKVGKEFEVIILSCHYEIVSPNALEEYSEGENFEDKLQYQVSFVAIPKEVIYKPLQITPKAKVHSTLTAIVSSGTSDTTEHENEIEVDEKGRVKVLFHFDENQTISTYIRVSNFYAGNGYGAQFIPRVNSEVLVSFVNGDIDKPIVVGCMYNGENKMPYNLPKEKTKSYIRTHSMPAYEDEVGYNEISFEDKRGEEKLSFRAQKDYELEVQNDSIVTVDHDMKTIIGNDENITIQNDLTQTIGKDSNRSIQANDIKVVEKDEVHTINKDKELYVLNDFNTIVQNNQKTIVEKDMTTRVKGNFLNYVHKDVKNKYLDSAYTQVGVDYRVDVSNAYHLNAANVKYTTGLYEVISNDGISLKCGGSVLTVDASGIHLKAPQVDTASENGGIEADLVEAIEIEKPTYNKIRVTNLSVDIDKQSNITETLTFTAEVEIYEDDAWVASTELTETQKSQINWAFVKNNDTGDKDILTDNPMDDNITEDGLTLTVDIQKDNIYKYAHVHCYVSEPEAEGYAMSELMRYLEVDDIKSKYISNEKGECIAILNVEEPREEELSQIRWKIEEKDKSEYNGQSTITHNLKDEGVHEINFMAYIKGELEKSAHTYLTFDEKEKELTNLGFENE